jgi:hypothetical protein
LNPKRLKIKIVKTFETCISNNAIKRKRDRDNPRKLSKNSEENAWKNLEKDFHKLNGFGGDISKNTAIDKSKRAKLKLINIT